MTTRADVIAEARTWIGTPFAHQGRIKGEWCDCAGLIVGVARALGISTFDYTQYGPIPVPGHMGRLLDENLNRIEAGKQQGGDIFWMRDLIRSASVPRHLGILTFDGTIIHAENSAGRVVEHTFTEVYERRVLRWYAFRGVS